jgi:hypothetical protein
MIAYLKGDRVRKNMLVSIFVPGCNEHPNILLRSLVSSLHSLICFKRSLRPDPFLKSAVRTVLIFGNDRKDETAEIPKNADEHSLLFEKCTDSLGKGKGKEENPFDKLFECVQQLSREDIGRLAVLAADDIFVSKAPEKSSLNETIEKLAVDDPVSSFFPGRSFPPLALSSLVPSPRPLFPGPLALSPLPLPSSPLSPLPSPLSPPLPSSPLSPPLPSLLFYLLTLNKNWNLWTEVASGIYRNKTGKIRTEYVDESLSILPPPPPLLPLPNPLHLIPNPLPLLPTPLPLPITNLLFLSLFMTKRTKELFGKGPQMINALKVLDDQVASLQERRALAKTIPAQDPALALAQAKAKAQDSDGFSVTIEGQSPNPSSSSSDDADAFPMTDVGGETEGQKPKKWTARCPARALTRIRNSLYSSFFSGTKLL